MDRFCCGVVILLLQLDSVKLFPSFKDLIPNGNNVPHPCISSQIWHGVGHISRYGAGPLNSFGSDFLRHGKNWTELCHIDSDKDGFTNGDELGDPSCTWKPGSQIKLSLPLSHPGICDSIDQCSNGDVIHFNCSRKGRDSKIEDPISNSVVKLPPHANQEVGEELEIIPNIQILQRIRKNDPVLNITDEEDRDQTKSTDGRSIPISLPRASLKPSESQTNLQPFNTLSGKPSTQNSRTASNISVLNTNDASSLQNALLRGITRPRTKLSDIFGISNTGVTTSNNNNINGMSVPRRTVVLPNISPQFPNRNIIQAQSQFPNTNSVRSLNPLSALGRSSFPSLLQRNANLSTTNRIPFPPLSVNGIWSQSQNPFRTFPRGFLPQGANVLPSFPRDTNRQSPFLQSSENRNLAFPRANSFQIPWQDPNTRFRLVQNIANRRQTFPSVVNQRQNTLQRRPAFTGPAHQVIRNMGTQVSELPTSNTLRSSRRGGSTARFIVRTMRRIMRPPFVCPGLITQNTNTWSLRLPRVRIPIRFKSGVCMVFNVPQTGDFHLTGGVPVIDNRDVVKQIFLYGCDENARVPVTSQPYPCDSLPRQECQNVIGGYSGSIPGICLPPSGGIRIGRSGFKQVVLQVRWINLFGRSGMTDSSGINLYYTRRLRQYDIGIKVLRATHFSIPPKQPSFIVSSTCPGDCTVRQIRSPIYVGMAFNQMHSLGRREKVEVVRNRQVVGVITNENAFSYSDPKEYRHQNPIQVLPGDSLRMSCVYNSMNANSTVSWGYGERNEICLSTLFFYPKENWDSTSCTSYRSIPLCRLETTGTVNDCDFSNFFSTLRRDFQTYSVLTNCTLQRICNEECKSLSNFAKAHPCFIGDNFDLLQTSVNIIPDERLQALFQTMKLCDS